MLGKIFYPESIAVIGASTDPNKTGHIIFKNILHGFKGAVYPVNPKAGEILGVKAYPSILDVPAGSVDLAVIIIPAKFVEQALLECSKKNVKGAVVISGGFAEAGNEQMQASLVATGRKLGIRIIGPNCQGFNNPHAGVCASWPYVGAKGKMAVVSQSGTVGATIECWAADEGLGISKFVSLGNRCDIDEAELIEFFSRDETVSTIALYVESIKDGKKFMDSVRGSGKPVVVLKSGRSEYGARAAASHTRSLAGRDEIYGAAFRKAGAIRVDSIEEMYDVSKLLAYGPPVRENGILIITSSGGCGILAADLVKKAGLELAPLGEEVKKKLAGLLPGHCILSNPLDLTGDTDAARYETVLRETSAPSLVIFGDPIPGAAEVAEKFKGRIIVCYLGGGEIEQSEKRKMHSLGIPVLPTPERAVVALGKLVNYNNHPKR